MKIIKQGFECITSKEQYQNTALLIEKMARVCYKSEDKITEGSAAKLVDKLIHREHNTMLEFADLTFKFTVDTKIAAALGRHRHTTQAHESTHYIDYTNKDELIFIEQVEADEYDTYALAEHYRHVELMYFRNEQFTSMPHTLRRIILPFALKTEMNVKANLAEWRHIIRLRASDKDHPQMTALMLDLLRWFRAELPWAVKDITYET